MAEKLPDGVANMDDYREKVEPATGGARHEAVEMGDYATEKARATLEMAKIIEDIEFPDDDFEQLQSFDHEKLNSLREALYGKLEDLALDDNGQIKNENRHVVKLIGQRLVVLDELLSVRSSEQKAEELFTNKEAA